MPDHPNSVNQLLHDGDAPLSRLLNRAAQLHQLNLRLKLRLGHPASDHLTLANVRGGIAYLLVDSPAWLSRAHYMKPQLVNLLRDLGLAVEGLEILVTPPSGSAAQHKPACRTIPDAARQLLREFAANQQDHRLASALNRLAEAGSRKKPT